MDLRQCYEKMGGNYDDVFGRLKSEDRIKRFLMRVVEDGNFKLLCDSLEARDIPTAFRAAHTLKGVCLNFSLDRLLASASAVTEALRNKTEYDPAVQPLLDKLTADYELTMNCIKECTAG